MPDAFEERAALMEFDGGLTRPWAESLARLATAPKPGAYEPERWGQVVTDAARFVAGHLPRIVANGWTVEDVRGLLPMLMGREVVTVGMADVTVIQLSGAMGRIYRRPNPGGAARWDEGKRKS